MKVAIIKYNAGNIQSVIYALNRLGIEPVVTDNHEEIRNADKVIFPGVGEANSAMRSVESKGLDKLIIGLKQPVFGICVGLQLLCRYSEENDTKCLGVFDLDVKKFPNQSQKVPQIGWNNINDFKSPLFKGVEEDKYVYFVHSYYAELSEYTAAQSEYGVKFSAALQKDNFYAAQFHPEKSSRTGAKIIQNFLDI
ncbi:imidazole glycerol phosphate synthase subunit HisH [Flammeovirgaceae bacterium SG7u.111]|nr:imidazole glycerol phosphate synthase subunit HisH [Flammeovirgaceae bacterium SG7u.132]WPO35787.1 imidazole glycerol phosphate synthase subunit HisH [Flammeovirgaceae bacterium SG7u.111]